MTNMKSVCCGADAKTKNFNEANKKLSFKECSKCKQSCVVYYDHHGLPQECKVCGVEFLQSEGHSHGE